MISLTFSSSAQMLAYERLVEIGYKAKDTLLLITNNLGDDGSAIYARARAERCVELRARARSLWILAEALKDLMYRGKCSGAVRISSGPKSYRFATRLGPGTLQFLGRNREARQTWLTLAEHVEGFPEHHFDLVANGVNKLGMTMGDLKKAFEVALGAAD